MSIIGNPLVIGGNSGGGGGGNVEANKTATLTGGTSVINPSSGYDSMARVTATVANGTAGTPSATKGEVSSHSITVTPSVTNTTGYITGSTITGTDVTVSASELVSGTYNVTTAGTKAVTNYEKVSIPTLTLPTSTSSSATSAYTERAVVSRSTADQYINIGTGFNNVGGYYKISAVANGSAKPASSISATGATVSTGTNTLTLSKTVSNTPQVTAGYVSSGTTGNSTVSLTASVTTQAAQTIYPSTSDQTIASGRYLTGTQTIAGVTTTNLTADNIKSGVTVQVGDSSDTDRVVSVLGTYTGGGGGIGTLLSNQSLGTISTSSTSATSTGQTMSVSSINNYDLLMIDVSRDTKTNSRHASTVSFILLTNTTDVSTKNASAVVSNKWNVKWSSSGVGQSRQSTTAYGIYPYSCALSNGTATITFYQRYNSNYTGTINGAYTARAYGVNLYDLVGG